MAQAVVEILTIAVKPGMRDQFHVLYQSKALPLLRKWKFNVLAYGPSVHDPDSYFVIRRFDSLEHRQQSQDAYYSSDDWIKGPREAILSMADHFAYTVLPVESLTGIANQLSQMCRRDPA